MRTVSRITVAMSVIVMSLTSVGHTCAETNNLIRSMLSPLLVCTRLQGDRIVSRPHAVALRSDFFAGDDQWTEAEKREAFDWYLWHLTATAMPVRDGIMQSGNGRNPIAVAAFKQCQQGRSRWSLSSCGMVWMSGLCHLPMGSSPTLPNIQIRSETSRAEDSVTD